jgi:probable lipoprotein NlpC
LRIILKIILKILKSWPIGVLTIAIIYCSPLKPVAPQGKKTSSAQRSSAKNSTKPKIDYQNVQSITGIYDWDKILLPWLGTPYLSGGNTKDGADCSGFVSSVYLEKAGMYLPRTTTEEFKIGIAIHKDDLEIGDLVFFGEKIKVNHVGIYVGGGNFIHASSSRGVMISPLSDTYWAPLYIGARRYL